MEVIIRNIEFICKMCGEYLKAYQINTKDDSETKECPNCYYENTLADMLENEL